MNDVKKFAYNIQELMSFLEVLNDIKQGNMGRMGNACCKGLAWEPVDL